jgi:hypothetical protein
VEAALAAEGCPERVARAVAGAAAGRVSRVVPEPLERAPPSPEDTAYARLSGRLLATESIRTATAASYGFGFMARLVIAFIVVMGALVAALDFFPRVLRPASVAVPPQPIPVQLVPPPDKAGAR